MVKSESKVASNSKELLSCVQKEILDGSIEAGENTFTVMKRNGTIVPFRKERIFRAIEAAFKLARQYTIAKGERDRVKVIARSPSYHGSTMGAFAASSDPEMENTFQKIKSSCKRPIYC